MFMESGRIKLRVTRLVSLTIERDCQAYGFVKNDGEANRNGLLNHLIPHLYERRRSAWDASSPSLRRQWRRDADAICSVVSMAFDEAYFESDSMAPLERREVWLRPT